MKKFLKVGCLSIVGLFVLIFIISIFSSESSEASDLNTNEVSKGDPDIHYREAINALKSENFFAANNSLRRIVNIDSTYSKIDSLRSVIKDQHAKGLKSIDDELKSLKSKLTFDKDEFKQTTFVHHKVGKGSYGNTVYCYFGMKGNQAQSPRFVIQYYGDDWLFWEKATFLIDGSPYIYVPDNRPKHDNTSSVWETSDEPLTANMQTILKAMFTAKEVKYRLDGKYYKDFNLSKSRITAMEEVLRYNYILTNQDKVRNFKLN